MTAPPAIPRLLRPRSIAFVWLLILSWVVGGARTAEAATITASYDQGRAGVIINGYGTRAMGSFHLRDAAEDLLAWCLEADVPHSTQADAYRSISPSVASAELDALLWWLEGQESLDPDTAVAAAGLIWFYSGARRSNGPLVWSDGSRAFAPISPVAPEAWDALPPLSLADPVGLMVPGAHLDAAERRVLELHRLATALAGPWQLSVDVDRDRAAATADLRAPAGPLGGLQVEFVIEAPGTEPLVRRAPTGSDGRARIPLPVLPAGATVRAAAVAPGPHQEWDGDGSVQRLATATSVPVRAVTTLPPTPVHVEVHKRSTDPTIAVGGGVFVLSDRDGNEVGTAISAVDGVARFAPIDPVQHPVPYRLREREAPPGLEPTDAIVDIPVASHDPDAPTIVEVANGPVTVPLVLRKRLSIDDAGPTDLGGFAFEARRRADGATHRLVTGPDGASPPVELPWGTYDVCEVEVPDWATALIDTGCRTVVVDATAHPSDGIVIDYVNEIPGPGIDTHFVDPADGDQLIEGRDDAPAGVIELVDGVTLTGLVPGVRYVIDGEVVRLGGAGDPVLATAQLEFVADGPTADVDIVFGVGGLSSGIVVAGERVSVGGVVLADHRDLTDPDQTITVIPPPPTSTTTTTTTTTTSTTTVPDSTVSPSSSTTTAPTLPSTVPLDGPPVTSVPTPPPPSTLPRTGSDAAARVLRLGDTGFAIGVALVALAGLVPRRSGRDEAGC